MTTATMNHTELNNNELELVNGGIVMKRLRRFWGEEEADKKLVYPKMDVDNRPAVTPPAFKPTLPQA